MFIYLFVWFCVKHLFLRYYITKFLIYLFAVSLNFIRLLRVVITPSVVERRKRLEAIG